jgi:rhamnosyltransferase
MIPNSDRGRSELSVPRDDSAPATTLDANDVCGVLVTYHPDAEFPRRLAAMRRQLGAVVIVDNGSGEAARTMLRELGKDPSIEVVCEPEKRGVATALNIGLARAAARGFSWALLLDQDSRIDADLVAGLLAVYRAFPDRGRLAIIGAGFRDFREEPDATLHGAAADSWEELDYVITSGSLLSLASYREVGGFRDDFFIDYVDTEYCWRARARGFRVIKTRKHLMSHAIGKPSRHRLLWMTKWTTNHPPDRRYYIARNYTILAREQARERARQPPRGRGSGSGRGFPGRWVFKSLGLVFKLAKRVVLYEDRRREKLFALLQGWYHGVRGIAGARRGAR